MSARVLLADDHALLLGALEKLLVDECEVVGQVAVALGIGHRELVARDDEVVANRDAVPRLSGTASASAG